MSFLILGSGAREYSIAKRLYRDTLKGESIYCVSSFENYGMSLMGITTLLTNNIDEIVELALNKKIKYVIPGGESWLVTDLYYKLNGQNIKFIGPSKISAFLETDKIFARKLIQDSPLKMFNPKFVEILAKDFDSTRVYKLLTSYPVIKPRNI